MIENHKGYMVKPYKPVPNVLVIATVGQGGKVPNILSGLYTSYNTAVRAIDDYVASRPVKEKADAKTTSEAGS